MSWVNNVTSSASDLWDQTVKAAERAGYAAKEGGKAVLAEYGWEDVTKMAAGTAGGAVAGSRAATYVSANLAVRGGAKAVLKGALVGSGVFSVLAALPDLLTFGGAFAAAWNEYDE